MKLFDQDSPGISGAPEMEDYFASSLAAGDFDGDGTDDLVVGMRSEELNSATGGVITKGALWIDQDTDKVPGDPVVGDHFGWTVGAPGNAAGTVTVLKVKPGTLESATAFAEADLGFAAGSDGDAFGAALPH